MTLRLWEIEKSGDCDLTEVADACSGIKAIKLYGSQGYIDVKHYLTTWIKKGRLKLMIKSANFNAEFKVYIGLVQDKIIYIRISPPGSLEWYDGSAYNSIASIDPTGNYHEMIIEWDADENIVNVMWDGSQYSAGFASGSPAKPIIALTLVGKGESLGDFYVDDIIVETNNGIVFKEDWEPLAHRIKDIADFTNAVKDKQYPEEIFAYLATGKMSYLEDAKTAIQNYTPYKTDAEFARCLIASAIIKMIDLTFNEVVRLADFAVSKQNDIGLWDTGDGYCHPETASKIVEGLLWAYRVTGNSAYLEAAKKYLDKIEEIRINNNGWIPRIITLTGDVQTLYPRYYLEMGSHAALNYFVYLLTGDKTYLNRARSIIDKVVAELWDGNAFCYSPENKLYEIQLSWFDPILIMMGYNADKALADILYRILDVNKDTAYTDGHLHGIEVSNDLVKHAVYRDGSDYTNHQSLFPFNKAVPIALLYYAVVNNVDLITNIEQAIIALERHRKDNGYIGAIDPYNFAPDPYDDRPRHEHAFIYPFLLLQALIKPPSVDLLPKHYGGATLMFWSDYRLDIENKKLIGYFKAGTYRFYLGTREVSYTFSRDGHYIIAFSDDFNDIVSVEPATPSLEIIAVETPSEVNASEQFLISVTIRNNKSTDTYCIIRVYNEKSNEVTHFTTTVIPAGEECTYNVPVTAPTGPGTYTWTVAVEDPDTKEITDYRQFTFTVVSPLPSTKAEERRLLFFLLLIAAAIILALLVEQGE